MAPKATKVASKPTYAVMVQESIKALKDRSGSSVQAITKQLIASYKIDINKPALSAALKKGVDSGDLVKVKASYKLGKKVKAPAKPKVTTTKTKKKVTAPAKTAAPKKKAPVTTAKPKKVIKKGPKTTSTTSTKKKTTTTTKKKTSSRK